MHCTSCGAEIRDDADFCTSCGAPIVTPVVASTTPFQTPVAQRASANPATATMNGTAMASDGANDQKRMRIILIALVAIAVALMAFIVFFIMHQQEQKRLSPRPVTVSVQADGYNDGCTLIPVSIVGTDSRGNDVDTVGFIDMYGEGISLAPGSYDLSFPASPLTEDGILYIVPTDVGYVEIEEAIEEDQEPINVFEGNPAHFKKSTAIDETDQMIESAYEHAILDEEQTERADELKKVAQNVHNQAVDEKRKRDEIEAARTIDMPSYTVRIPEYWVGKVDIIKSGNNLTIKPKGMGGEESLIAFECVPASDQLNEGDYMSHIIDYANTSNGQRVEGWAVMYPALAVEPYNKLSDAQLSPLIDLQTGGQCSLSSVRGDTAETWYKRTEKYARLTSSYLENNVVLTVK